MTDPKTREKPRRTKARSPSRRGRAKTPDKAPRTAPAARRGGGQELWLYGHHAVLAALRNPRRACRLLLATEQGLAKLGPAAQRSGVEIRLADPREIARTLPPGAAHQGVALGVAPLPPLALERVIAVQPADSLFLLLDRITDPRNFGAILRSAVAFGVAAVIVQQRRSAEWSGAAAKAASGALDMIPLVEVVNLARALERLREAGFRITGLDAAAPTAVEALAPVPRRVLVLGSEGEGMRRLVAAGCDERARLVVDPRIDSLNVAVAAGIALYLLRPRRDGAPG